MQTITNNQYRLSPQQRRVWELQRESPGSRIHAACLIEGKLDVQALRRGVRSIIERHEAFRTRLRSLPELKFPVQEILEEALWQEIGPSNSETAISESELLSLLEQESARHNLLNDDPPLGVTLLPLACERHVLMISSPALLADSTTLRNFLAELALELDPAGTEPAHTETSVQYVDYAAWRNELWEQDNDISEEGQSYWQKNLDLKALDYRLPRHAAAASSHFTPQFIPARIAPEVVEKLAVLAEQQGASLESLLLACWGSLLHRFLQEANILIGVTLNGRPHQELQGGMGLYSQTVPVSMRFPPAIDFLQLLRETSDAIRQASLWQDYFQWPEAAGTRPRYCPFGFSWRQSSQSQVIGELTFTICAEYGREDRFELQLICSTEEKCIAGILAYDPACFDRFEVEQIARRWERLCLAISESGQRQVSCLPVLTADDKRQLLDEWNQTRDDLFTPQCIQDCFETQAEQTPELTAVVCGDQRLSYRDLNRRANQLARRLVSAGVGLETPVCLLVGRSVEMLVGLLGILKAGGVYVPLDAAHPVKERIAQLIQDTQAPVILTHERLRSHVPEGLCQVISLDGDQSISRYDSENLNLARQPENLAYIIYTSGSTGRPKGVMVEHGSVANLWSALRKALYDGNPTHPYRASLNAPISFDASIKQILLLLGGHTLFILPEEIRGSPDNFVAYLRENQIDILDCTPSHLLLLLEAGLLDQPGKTPSMALVGGEAIDAALWEKLASNQETRFFNVYGPTECTGDSTACEVSPDSGPPSIGGPLSNVQTYILDESLNLQPIGVPGELYIGGKGVARGYWNAPDLTAWRFAPNPFSDRPGARLYKTGDRARYLPGGKIEYLGRLDRQVKIRGFRIEPEEITAALRQHPQIREVVVAAREENGGGHRLVAYVVSAASSSFSLTELREYLESRLPEYMIPTALVTLDALPLSANNKIDWQALPVPDQLRPELCSNFQPPATPVEISLAKIWESVLGIKQVGVRDNFFELGGHSLLAMQVISRVRKEFSVEIVLPRLFQRPTIEGLASAIDEALRQQEPVPVSIPALPRGGRGIDQFKDRLTELAAGD